MLVMVKIIETREKSKLKGLYLSKLKDKLLIVTKLTKPPKLGSLVDQESRGRQGFPKTLSFTPKSLQLKPQISSKSSPDHILVNTS
ncbi:hypothetical protein Hanom_Chr10g00889941 [Helianthus anomalus]